MGPTRHTLLCPPPPRPHPIDGNPLGFVPDLSMRGVGDNLIGGDDVHGPTTTFQWMLLLSNRYTTSNGCHDLVGARHPATRAPIQQAIEELARTGMEQVLNLLDGNEVCQSKTESQMKWGFEDSTTGGWTSTRAYKQVA